MEQLPTHVATLDEPIPAPHGDRFDGPDIRVAPAIADLLRDLDRFAHDEDVVGYVERFREQLDAIGADVSVAIEQDGTECLMVGNRCDSQVRHRARWIHFLFEHLDRDAERRRYLVRQLRREGRFVDDRPSDSRRTTQTIRDFLRYGGRILLDPRGCLMEGGGIPRPMLEPNSAAACERACRAYFDMRRRWRAAPQIARAVGMLGERTDNGWIVLEARTRQARIA